MSCQVCNKRATAGQCMEGYVHYLSGDFPCPFNPDPVASPRNLVELAPLNYTRRAAPAPTADGLEDLL